MNIITRLTVKLTTLNQRLLNTILQFGIPRYGKKLVLLVSIFSGLQQLKKVTHEDLESLNVELGLASCSEALEFPALVSKQVWDRYDFQDSELDGTKECSAISLFNKVPTWLRYDTNEKMLRDIRDVLTHSDYRAA